MNRKQKRAQARQRVIVAGDSIVAEPTGSHYKVTRSAQLPPKRTGKHRWVAAASWIISPNQYDQLDTTEIKLLDRENIMYLAIGCWDCELTYGEAKDTMCTSPGDN